MKRTIMNKSIFAVATIFLVLFAIQACDKDDGSTPPPVSDGCKSINYCQVIAPDPTYAWINSVTFNGIKFESGLDDGYEFHDDTPDFIFKRGECLRIWIQQEPSGPPQAGQYAIFIDFNQDNDFDDPGEKAFTNGEIHINGYNGQPGTIYIPGDAKIGSTRLRVIMFLGNENTILNPCEKIAEGEIEDYCITIEDANSTPNCAGIPEAPTVVSIEEELAEFKWDFVKDAVSYVVRIKDVKHEPNDWKEYEVTEPQISINNFFFDCFEHYEIQVAAVCSNKERGYFSHSTFLRAKCPNDTPSDCLAPDGIGECSVEKTKAVLAWASANAPYKNYTLRYKKKSDSNWSSTITVPGGANATYYELTGLTSNTSYEAQLGAICNDDKATDFSSSYEFKTKE